MRIPVENISKSDAIETAMSYMAQWKMLLEREGKLDNLSFSPGDLDRICKVLLVGIGELSK
jgi:hypothetical protein